MSPCCAPPPPTTIAAWLLQLPTHIIHWRGGCLARFWRRAGGPPASSPSLLPERLLLGLQPRQDTRTVRAGTAGVPTRPPRPSATQSQRAQRPLLDACREGGAAGLAGTRSGAWRSHRSPFWAGVQNRPRPSTARSWAGGAGVPATLRAAQSAIPPSVPAVPWGSPCLREGTGQ